ncbi:MAG: YlxR family protein [Symploca sp. SIO3C6]|nr:YlxR family protein [Symploca sp. SIO3C6]
MKKNYRCCIGCRRVAHRSEFWRIVRQYPSHTVQIDQGMGRSAYICPSAQCIQAAQKKNRLGRVLKTSIPPSVYDELANRLV